MLLEEIGELAPAAQDSLVCLRNSASTNGGFRLLTTSSQDVDALANRKILRSDLRYRLDVVRLELPPLRQRPDDVVFLADHLLAFTARHLRRPVQSLSPDACDALVRHRWAGNVRELRNCIFESALWCSNQCLRASDLRLHQPTAGDPEATLVATLSQLHTVYPTDLYERTQRLLLQWALVACEGNRSRAAALLGIGRSSLCGKLRRYGLEGG